MYQGEPLVALATRQEFPVTQRWRAIISVFFVILLVSACAPGGNPLAGEALADASPAGFFLGVWHGFIIIITFVVSLFSDAVGVYEVHNTGWSYNLGYLLGLMMALGSGGAASTKKR
jgi:hypothetical protein